MRYVQTVLLAVVIGILVMACTGCSGGEDGSADPAISERSADSLLVEMTAVDTVSAFDLLKSAHVVESQSNLMGVFVTSIDSVDNGMSAFWVYSVNDTTPKVACDKLMLNPGDVLKWHYRRMGGSSADSSQ